MKNTDKVTLTVGQLKKLIKESNDKTDLEAQLEDAQEKLKHAREEFRAKQGRGISGIMLKRAQDKVAELKKQIKNSVEEASEKTWRGVPGTKFIWNGEWADPQVEYDNEIINANELEKFAWGIYVKDCEAEGKEPSEDEFDEDLPVKFFKDALNDYMFGEFGDVNESNETQTFYTWNINQQRDTGYGMESWKMVEGAKDTFATEDEARRNGIKHLKLYNTGDYELEIWDDDDSPNLISVVEIHDGEITEY